MIREKLVKKQIGNDGKFRWRGHEISRIEGLSDAVFGFAVTLLVVSLEVPKTYAELMSAMRGFGAFAVSFTLLFLVWFSHYKFFRRYGLKDTMTVVLNAALLFVILFYVYPLKFLFTYLFNELTGGGGLVRLANGTMEPMVENGHQAVSLMVIFGAGYIAVFSVFVLLYWHAYRQRVTLELNELETFDTRTDIQESSINVGVGCLSVAIAAIGGPRFVGLSGFAFMLTGIIMTFHGMARGRGRRKLEEQYAVSEDGETE